MTTQANKVLLRRYKVDILNSRDLQALDQVAAADYLDHAAFPGQAAGLEGLKQRIATLFEALDPQWTIHDTIAEGDMVVLRWSHAGTHRREFLDIPPTGKTFVLRGIDMYRVRNGKIAEHWNVVDLLGFRQQVCSLCADRAGSAVKRRVGFWQVPPVALAVVFLQQGRNHLGDLAAGSPDPPRCPDDHHVFTASQVHQPGSSLERISVPAPARDRLRPAADDLAVCSLFARLPRYHPSAPGTGRHSITLGGA